MATKSVSGNGHLKKRPDGKWFVQVTLGTKHGKQIRKSKVCKTQKEAIEFRNEMNRLTARQQIVENSPLCFGDWLDKYHAKYVVGRLKQCTVEGYASAIKQIKEKHISSIRLQKLCRNDIQSYVDEISKTHAPGSVIKTYTIINNALKYAEIEERIPLNPCRNIILPKQTSETVQIFTEEQEKVFLKAIENHSHKACFLLGLYGLRRSEIVGLQVEDVDFKAGTITICHEYIDHYDGSVLHDYTKTNRPRTLPIDDKLMNLLEKHINGRTTGHVFLASKRNNAPLTGSGLYSSFKRLLKRVGLPNVKFHSLRHLCASKLLSVNPRIAADFLGHVKVGMTLDKYSHSSLENLSEALNVIKS